MLSIQKKDAICICKRNHILFRLREENVNQREELDQLKSFVLKEMRMKYKGCNHPTKEIIQFKKKQ